MQFICTIYLYICRLLPSVCLTLHVLLLSVHFLHHQLLEKKKSHYVRLLCYVCLLIHTHKKNIAFYLTAPFLCFAM